MPIIVSTTLRGNLLAKIDCTGNSDFFQLCPNASPPSNLEWIGWSIVSVESAVGLWGLNILAVASAVVVGLRWRRAVPAAFITSLVIAALSGFAVSLYASGPQLLDPARTDSVDAIRPVISVLTVAASSPYALAGLALFLAIRWVRPNWK